MKNKTQLTGDQILKKISKKLKKYSKQKFHGRYTMFMGRAQMLEIALKNLLVKKYGYDTDEIENWTLGRTKSTLEQKGLRGDFIALLKSLVDCRNYAAHSLIADEIIIRDILKGQMPKKHYTKQMRILNKSIIELEQVIYLFRWIDKNDAWEIKKHNQSKE
jgi:hypothetical protein